MLEKFEVAIFDERCTGWTPDTKFNKLFIEHTEHYLNDKLKILGFISLNEIYDSLGMPRALEAQIVGWKITDNLNENNCVKFELEKTDINPNIVINFKNMVELL